MRAVTNEPDTVVVALQALGATLSDAQRAQRFLAVTGLEQSDLRARAGDPTVLAALLRFLESHEPDLVSVAEAIGRKPEELVAVRSALEA